jgi:hypothetical protein
MAKRSARESKNPSNAGKIGDLDAAGVMRRKAEWQLSMSERLARLHALCKQMSAIDGAARAR